MTWKKTEMVLGDAEEENVDVSDRHRHRSTVRLTGCGLEGLGSQALRSKLLDPLSFRLGDFADARGVGATTTDFADSGGSEN